jgi:hypothetical protein
MKIPATTIALALASTLVVGFSGALRAGETVAEKAQAASNDVSRAANKTVHRVEEAACMQSDMKCLAEKAKHRAEEAKDYTKDKAKELKNDVDSDDASE